MMDNIENVQKFLKTLQVPLGFLELFDRFCITSGMFPTFQIVESEMSNGALSFLIEGTRKIGMS